MKPPSKTLWRIATSIHDQLGRMHHEAAPLTEGAEAWQNLQRAERLWRCAEMHGWQRAAAQLLPRLVRTTDALRDQLSRRLSDLSLLQRPSLLATPGDIYRDLESLADEFEEITIDHGSRELVVTTEAIEFDGLELGPFEIRLAWQNLRLSTPYRLVACEPNRASNNDSVTHPHVSDETLCEGDGRTAIRAALRRGLIGEFFLLVDRMLKTYAPGRAYVEVSDWHGTPCSDCGTTLQDGERSYCERCDDLLCSDCSTSCTNCNRSLCHSCCDSTCRECDSPLCESCARACSECRKSYCDNCLEGGRCAACSAEHDDEDITEPEAAPIAVQPDGLGQAAVSA